MSKFFSNAFSTAMAAYDSAMKRALCIPFVKVDKNRYLRRKLKNRLTDEELELVLNERPLSVLPMEEVKRMAKTEVRKHALIVMLLSTLSAVPQSGWLMWLGIAFDFIQFQVFVFVIMQKLLYLYGCKNLSSDNKNLSGSAEWILLLISTIMIGKHQVMRLAKSAAGMAVKQAIQRFAVRMLTKLMVFNVLRQCAKWFGIVLTKDMLVQGVNLMVPILCAIISGLISLWLFMPMTKRLQRHLTHLAEEGKDPMESVMEKM